MLALTLFAIVCIGQLMVSTAIFGLSAVSHLEELETRAKDGTDLCLKDTTKSVKVFEMAMSAGLWSCANEFVRNADSTSSLRVFKFKSVVSMFCYYHIPFRVVHHIRKTLSSSIKPYNEQGNSITYNHHTNFFHFLFSWICREITCGFKSDSWSTAKSIDEEYYRFEEYYRKQFTS